MKLHVVIVARGQHSEAGSAGFRGTAVRATPDQTTPDVLTRAVADAKVRVPVQQASTLNGAHAAFDDFSASTLGKLAITVTIAGDLR